MNVARIVSVIVCLCFLNSVWSHPHFSVAQAQEMLGKTEQELAELRTRHNGPPALNHEDSKQWQSLRVRLAECHFLLGDTQRSLAICNEVAKQYPDFPDVYSMRRAIYLTQGNGELADADARNYLRLGAGTPTLALQLISREVAEDDPNQALASRRLQLELAESALKQWPDEPALWAEKVRLLLQVNDPSALTIFADILHKGPDQRRLSAVESFETERGGEHLAKWLGDQDTVWLDKPPAKGQSDARVNLAGIFLRLNRPALAQRGAKAALVRLDQEEQAVDDQDIFADYVFQGISRDRSRCLAMLGRWSDALDIVNDMLAQHSDPVTWLPARVACLQKLGRAAEALEAEQAYRAIFEEIGLEADDLPAWP